MRTERLSISTKELDTLEHEWWNEHALGIEKIWALNFEYQKLIRLPYLKKMRSFFLKNTYQKQINLLEIGCGSGWVCRMIGDKNIHVLGTDFSEAQIDIARTQAKFFKKDTYCKYQIASVSDFSDKVDAVVIHAILHHLSKEELNDFFEQLKRIKPGCKVFIYEPVFITPQQKTPSLKDKLLNKIIFNVKKIAIEYAKKNGTIDQGIQSHLESMYSKARKEGWYLSPKEVPFYQDELNTYLKNDYVIANEYIVNKTDLEVAQAFVMNGFIKPSKLFSKMYFRLVQYLDKLAFKGNFTNYIQPLQHQFVCFEIIKK